jgi:hypothetical protein
MEVAGMTLLERSAAVASLAALLFVTQTPIRAASLNGSVGDEQDAGIAGARITLTEKSKELVLQSESDAGGSFLFPAATSYSLLCLQEVRQMSAQPTITSTPTLAIPTA